MTIHLLKSTNKGNTFAIASQPFNLNAPSFEVEAADTWDISFNFAPQIEASKDWISKGTLMVGCNMSMAKFSSTLNGGKLYLCHQQLNIEHVLVECSPIKRFKKELARTTRLPPILKISCPKPETILTPDKGFTFSLNNPIKLNAYISPNGFIKITVIDLNTDKTSIYTSTHDNLGVTKGTDLIPPFDYLSITVDLNQDYLDYLAQYDRISSKSHPFRAAIF